MFDINRHHHFAAAATDGKMKTKIISEGKTYVEKVVEEKLPIYVQQRGPELKLVLGGFVQVNVEGGAAFAFNGNFGETAINDRFRLRRARINLTGDYAEQFDFKRRLWPERWYFRQPDRLFRNRHLGQLPSISSGIGQGRPV